MKFKAPEGCTGISVGGEFFTVNEKGLIEVPDDGNYAAMLAPHGFEHVQPAAEPAKKAKAAASE